MSSDEREKLVALLREIAERPIDPEKLAAEEAARTDPWRWYCRLCGATGEVADGPGAREARDAEAYRHLDGGCPNGRHAVPASAEAGRLLHVWSYGMSAVADQN